jgi:hypothetical protein
MKKSFYIFIVTVGLIACNKDNEMDIRVRSNINDKAFYDSLVLGYINDTITQLIWFLDEWNKEYQSNENKVTDEAQKDVYKIFKLVYLPFNIDELGNHEWGNETYKGYQYAVVQNLIYFNYEFDSAYSINYDTIKDFRPDVRFPGVKTLFITSEIGSVIDSFLYIGNPEKNFDLRNVSKEDKNEIYKRASYLNKKIPVYPNHWGMGFHILTHPQVSEINFNTDRTKAKLNFRVVYMFGEAEFEKINGNWIMVSSAITGIE